MPADRNGGVGREVVEVTAPDGYRCNAVLLMPEGDGPFPGLVAVHGGMGNQSVETLVSFATAERDLPQRLLAQGYAVLVSDYRHPSHVHLEVDDTIAAYDFLCAHPQVRPDKVGLVGTSHGAVCSIYAGLRIRPACIIAEEGATDLAYRHRVFYESIREIPGELQGYAKLDKELWDELTERFGGTPDEVPEVYRRESAHTQAHKIQSPILIITGDGDYMPNCLLMYAGLRKARKVCELGYYENAPHAFWWAGRDIPASHEAERKAFSFLERHLKQ